MTNPMDSLDSPPQTPPPSLFRSTLGFLLVGMAWGLTTPFIRRAAVNLSASPSSTSNQSGRNWLQAKISNAIRTALNLLRTPAYAIPLVINLTGSIWFFLLVGKAGKPPPLPLPHVYRRDCHTGYASRRGMREGIEEVREERRGKEPG